MSETTRAATIRGQQEQQGMQPPTAPQPPQPSRQGAGPGGLDPRDGPVRVMLVAPSDDIRARLRAALTGAGMACSAVATRRDALQRLRTWAAAGQPGEGAFDVVIAESDLPDGRGLELAEAAHSGGVGLVLIGGEISTDDAVAAMRAGVMDMVSPAAAADVLAERTRAAAARARAQRRQRGRIVKLKRMCRRLSSAREQVAQQVDTLCTDLVQAYQELADHMNQVTTATEFKGLIRNELDIESLLRTTLEFVLSRSGPTNAAVFLPTTSGDYSLGAYVNYDCPKETVDILLDQLANSVAPRFENAEDLVYLCDREGLRRRMGDDAQWLDDSGVVAMACRHEGETLAIFMLFRDRRNIFGATLLEQIKTIGDLFAMQLARVIHIHHRHLPRDKWGMLGDPDTGSDDGYGDLAA